MNPPSVTGTAGSRSRVTIAPWTRPPPMPTASAAAIPHAGVPAPVSTATIPARPYIDAVERSYSPMIMQRPTASASSP